MTDSKTRPAADQASLAAATELCGLLDMVTAALREAIDKEDRLVLQVANQMIGRVGSLSGAYLAAGVH